MRQVVIFTMFALALPALVRAEEPFAKNGFTTVLKDDCLWVFKDGSDDSSAFQSGGEPSEHTTKIGAGPAGLTVRAPDRETALAYLRTYALWCQVAGGWIALVRPQVRCDNTGATPVTRVVA
jgi:hypothetical protein